jgi:hypothetical protein
MEGERSVMKKKRNLLFLLLGIAGLVYLIFFIKPASLPSDQSLMKEISSIFPEASPSSLQDKIYVDQKHVFVPFISEGNNKHGMSYWEWKHYHWRVNSIDLSGEPKLWKINRKDPGTFHIVWNIHPEDQVNFIDFYLIRDRNYQISDGVERYIPKVQLENRVVLEGKSYGVLKMPRDWLSFMKPYIDVESANQVDPLFNDILPAYNMFIGWIPYDRLNQEKFPEQSVNGSSFSNGDSDIDFIRILNRVELELP